MYTFPHMDGKKSLSLSIIAVTASFALGQILLYLCLDLSLGFSGPGRLAFYPVSLAFHGVTAAFLLFNRHEFVIESSGVALTRVNLANVLTLVRMSSLPTIVFLLVLRHRSNNLPAVLALCCIVFLTDLLDGFVSRTMRQGTRIGRMLDSISDYCLLGAFSIALFHFGLLADWFFACILSRLLLQALGMSIFFLVGRPLEPKPTVFGKVAVATTMVLYTMSIMRLMANQVFTRIFETCQVAAALIVCLSMLDKLYIFIRHAINERDGVKGDSHGDD